MDFCFCNSRSDRIDIEADRMALHASRFDQEGSATTERIENTLARCRVLSEKGLNDGWVKLGWEAEKVVG